MDGPSVSDERLCDCCRERRRDNETALRDAAERGDVERCKVLLDRARMADLLPDVNSRNEDGWTALHFAINEGYGAVTSLLLDSAADIEARTKQLKTPLHIASCRGDLNTVRLLLPRGANIAAQDIDGNTCLHIISMYGMNKLMQWLATNANIVPAKRIKNKEGKTAADVAANPDIVGMLGEHKPKDTRSRDSHPGPKQTNQVHVYHTSQHTVNKYMGNMTNKPAGDANQDDVERVSWLDSSCCPTSTTSTNNINQQHQPLSQHPQPPQPPLSQKPQNLEQQGRSQYVSTTLRTGHRASYRRSSTTTSPSVSAQQSQPTWST